MVYRGKLFQSRLQKHSTHMGIPSTVVGWSTKSTNIHAVCLHGSKEDEINEVWTKMNF